MGRGITRYECRCGGEITEQWDYQGTIFNCDKCDDPKPASGDSLITYFKENNKKNTDINF
jgi:hypothetical protein